MDYHTQALDMLLAALLPLPAYTWARPVSSPLCTEITKFREHVNKKFYYLDQKILKFKMDNIMDKSENQGPDEIIN